MTTKFTERYFKRRTANGEREVDSSKVEESSSFESDFPNSNDGSIDSEHSVSTTDPVKSVVEAEQLSKDVSDKDSDLSFLILWFFFMISL
mmetsp:Transcript_14048/g.29026  ORF Transcript_14048/g.29026 Transcript_14048/m.29026 type:complete len:90 (-) Transcript_14048:233-502(-)